MRNLTILLYFMCSQTCLNGIYIVGSDPPSVLGAEVSLEVLIAYLKLSCLHYFKQGMMSYKVLKLTTQE